MKMTKILVSVVLLLLCIFSGRASADDIHISAAASTKDALRQILDGFKKVRPGSTILTNFSSAGALAKQIVQGAPTDIFISANPKWLDLVVKEGKSEVSTRRVLAYNTLVLVGRKEISISSLEQLSELKRIAIGSPASVPAGQYAEQAMQAAGIYDGLVKDKKLVMAQDVRQALLYADRGEVDGAFVYKTDALLAEHAVVLLTVPEGLYDRVSYPMVMTGSGAAKDDVKALYSYLGGPEAKAILQKFGFETTE